jgi:branched-chain amino acid transport system substrate-binding protein
MIEGLSGPFANTGEAVFRNLVWATERVNARGGVKLPGGNRPLAIERFDSKGQTEEALSALALGDRPRHHHRHPGQQLGCGGRADRRHQQAQRARHRARQVLFLNYSAVDPVLTNEKCSYWHFRFDAHADMRMTALMSVLREDRR